MITDRKDIISILSVLRSVLLEIDFFEIIHVFFRVQVLAINIINDNRLMFLNVIHYFIVAQKIFDIKRINLLIIGEFLHGRLLNGIIFVIVSFCFRRKLFILVFLFCCLQRIKNHIVFCFGGKCLKLFQ